MTDPSQEGDTPDREQGVRTINVSSSPIEKGTDPLGDRPQGYRRKSQLILTPVLGVLFTVLALIDFSTGHIGRGLLATVVAILNAYMAAQEQRKPKRPQEN